MRATSIEPPYLRLAGGCFICHFLLPSLSDLYTDNVSDHLILLFFILVPVHENCPRHIDPPNKRHYHQAIEGKHTLFNKDSGSILMYSRGYANHTFKMTFFHLINHRLSRLV
ncbi:unnamed protein product, partial [Ectocarpus sp. 4 AP-2014]